MYIVIWILLTILIAVWAARWNRSGLVWFAIAFLLSPLVGALILLIAGKNNKQDEVEALAIKLNNEDKVKTAIVEYLELYVAYEDKAKEHPILSRKYREFTENLGSDGVLDIELRDVDKYTLMLSNYVR